MKDRIPVNPGRVLITPENGSAAFYATMTRADNPTQEGDALSKNTLLKDSTAEALGLSDAALPDDALRILSRLHAGLGNEYLWAVTSNDWGIAEEGEQLVVVSKTNTIYYSDSYTLSSDGVLSLVNPSSLTLGYESTPALHGKYVSFTTEYSTGNSPTGNIFGLCTSTYAGGQMMPDLTVKIMKAVQSGEIIKYVNSPNPNAYPLAEDDGYTYQALGKLGEKVRIATGSYAGNGKSGAGNANSITLNFSPKAGVVFSANNSAIGSGSWGSYDKKAMFIVNGAALVIPDSQYDPHISISGNTVKWEGYNASDQMNINGRTYRYIFFG